MIKEESGEEEKNNTSKKTITASYRWIALKEYRSAALPVRAAHTRDTSAPTHILKNNKYHLPSHR